MIIGEKNLIIGKFNSIINKFSISIFLYIKNTKNFILITLKPISYKIEILNKSPPNVC